MALTFSSLSLKVVIQDVVVSAIRAHLPWHSCYVSPQINGWATLLDYVLDTEGEPAYIETAVCLCRACHCPGIVFRMLFPECLFYWLVNEKGELVDYSYFDNFNKM